MAFDLENLSYIADLVGMAVVLRDYCDNLEYLNEEHKMLVDIADALQNVRPKDLTLEGKAIYLEYSAYFWNEIAERIYTDKAALARYEHETVGMVSWSEEYELKRYNQKLEYCKTKLTEGDN